MIRSRKKLPKDQNQLAYEIARISTEEPEQPKEEQPSQKSIVSAYLAIIGRKGGLKGGRARASKLSAKKRSQIARKAAKARWNKKKNT